MTPVDALVKMTEVDYDPFAVSQFVRSFPTTDAQREIWLAAELGREASLAYNESVSFVMRGPVKVPVLRAALHALTDRHEALRATFDAEGANMVIARQINLAMDVVDLAGGDPSVRAQGLADLRAEAVETPFDLLNGPLIRSVLVRTADDAYELILTAHHIICDGWSFGVVSRDLMSLYEQLAGGRTADRLPPADSFGDYSLSSLEVEHTRTTDADEHYWVSVYDRGQPVLDLPADRPRGRHRAFASQRIDYILPKQLVDASRQLGAKQGVSLFATLFGVFAGLLERLGGDGEVVLGVPSAGQSTRGLDALVGHCVNLLPVRVTIDRTDSVAKLLQHAGTRILDAYDHQSCTFGQLLTKLNVPREANRLPLVSALFNIDTPIPANALSRGGLAVSLRSNPRAFETFELFVNASQTDAGVVLECQYHSELFDAETVERWLALYKCALERAVADPARPLGELFSAAPEDLAKLRGFNPPSQLYARSDRVEALVSRQCALTPDATAVVTGQERLTYRELDEKSNGVANALIARGIGPGQRVGMACGRNIHMLPAMLGILKSGAAYVPLDPSFPQDRLSYMIADAGIRCIVSDRSVQSSGSAGIDVLLADELPPEPKAVAAVADPMAAAYVMYTSGSTGKPKGVVVHHQAVVNFLTSMAREPGLSAADRLVAVTTTSFDIAVLELFLPLTVGAQTIVADRDTVLDGALLRRLMEQCDATVLQATPAGWRLLIDAGWTGGDAFKALVGGEALPEDLAHDLVARAGAVWNMYGPTETTVWSACWPVPRVRAGIRIGRPIANTEVLVLDEAMKPCPIGVPGEIFIGGEGVATGYWGQSALTAERFLIIDGSRVYRTGDRGRWRNDGTLEHLGRLDFQVKVRGYRIELGEIEACLVQHADVEQAVVLAREDEPGDVKLVAYVVPAAGTSIEPKELRKFLRSGLPDYMLPSQILALPAIPLLPNGKVNRSALPRPDAGPRAHLALVTPSTPTQAAVLQAMEDVLNLRGLGVDDDFFAAGGHSLLAARLTARLNKAFGLTLPLRTVFQHSSTRALSDLIAANSTIGLRAVTHVPVQSNQSDGPLTVMQESIRFMEDLYPGRVVYNTPSAHRLKGAFDAAAFNSAFHTMIERQPSLRTYIAMGEDGPRQRVATLAPIKIPCEDLSSIDEATREAVLLQRMQALIDQPLDIHAAPLFRVALYRLGPEEHVFLFMPHHIIWDGWSFDLLYEEMSALYAAALTHRVANMAPLQVSYLDYAYWHREWMAGDDCRAQIDYWRQRFAAIEAPRALPTDRPRRAGMSGEGKVEWVRVDKPLTERLHKIAMEHGATLNMLILAVYAAQIAQATSNGSVVIGLPVRGRVVADVEPVMGFFVNVLPTPLTFQKDLQISSWLAVVKNEFIGAFAHQDVPFERLAVEPEFAKYGNSSGLYQSLFSFQDARERQRRWGPLAHSSILVMQKGAPADFGLWLMQVPGGLEGGINYNADLFDEQTARIFRVRILGLLRRVADNPAQTIADVLSAPGSDTDAFNGWIESRQTDGAPPARRTTAANGSQPAGTSLALAGIWARLLGIDVEDIDPNDNFFDLGGTSLLVMRAVAEHKQETGLDVEPRRYTHQTLRQLAAPVDAAPAQGAVAIRMEVMTGIWAKVIGIDPIHIGPDDNFFDLGGNSLLAMQSITACEQQLSVKIEPRRMAFATLRQLAEAPSMDAPSEPEAPPSPAVLPKSETGLMSRMIGRLGRRG